MPGQDRFGRAVTGAFTGVGRGAFTGAVAGAVLALAPALVPAARAQALSELSCRALWYQRNAVYAERGYCFKSADAVATFGERCFPPYGELTPSQQRYVDEVKMWEARKGCR